MVPSPACSTALFCDSREKSSSRYGRLTRRRLDEQGGPYADMISHNLFSRSARTRSHKRASPRSWKVLTQSRLSTPPSPS